MRNQHVSLCNSNPDVFSEEREYKIKLRLLIEFTTSGAQSYLLSAKSKYEQQSNTLKNRVILKIIIKEFLAKCSMPDDFHENLLHTIIYFKIRKFIMRDMHGKLTNFNQEVLNNCKTIKFPETLKSHGE